ncbi:Disulfide bond formation protein D precursor [Roseovarius albus]|uniref:Disulfide bond formation protein D n=1 Tax=Roseovarius albus TaxID=1247867 RepID=A0A1X6YBJ5_9RHOB|nr:DsbA family protein [Roseovarius albus]SLN15993.1 Disulfide bond formation protein D precursor [Roseovarius albus]
MLKSTLSALTLATACLALPAQAIDLDSMSVDEREAFRAEIRAYLLENPEVIMEAVSVLEQREAAAQQQSDVELVEQNREALFNDGHSWVGGNPEGDITLVEFMDYRCGYCKRAAPEVEGLLASDGNIKLVIKEFPILGEASVLASRFAIATQQVAGEDSYKAIHDALIAFKGDISESSLGRLGEALDLDTNAIIAHMNSPEVDQVIAENHQLAQKLQISGTPSFVMEDQMMRGYLPVDAMQQIATQIRTQ